MVPPGAGLDVQLDAVGGEVVPTRRTRAGLGMEGNLEAMLFGPVLPGQADVPFTEVACGIAGLAQNFRQGNQFGIQIVLAGGVEERFVAWSSLGVTRLLLGPGGLMSACGGYTMP